jgi:hypothetical protein
MTTLYTNIGRLTFLMCFIIAQQASATLLSVPYYAQRSFFAAGDTNHLHNLSQWCWNASSEMVLDTPLSASYPGTFFDQDTIAAYGSQSSNYWNYIFGSAARSTNSITGVVQPALNGIDLILKNFGSLGSVANYRALTSAELQTEIDSSRPCIARIGWCNNAAGIPYTNNAGGHFVVLYGFDGTIIDINDPWPDNGPVMQTYASFANSSITGAVYTANSGRFEWTHTLTLGASLDVVFLIDTTGSMGGSIGSIQAAAISITTNIFAHFPEARIAVRDFKDNPIHSGDPYLDRVDTEFTTNAAAIQSAVNTLSAGGGGDTPEAQYTALIDTLTGTDVGGWRTNPTPRVIIIATDAPGHDPVEPWAGGFSRSDVIAKATIPGKEISIFAIVPGSDPDAIADMTALAAGTGGAEYSSSYGGLADIIPNVIGSVATSLRHPQGLVTSAKPQFTFVPAQIGMGTVPTGYTIQILKSNETTHAWALYLETPISGNTFTPSTALPLGTYEWRLGSMQPASTIYSPAATPDLLNTIPAGLIHENGFTEFQLIVAPIAEGGGPSLIGPPQFFSSTSFTSISPFSNTWNVNFIFGTTGASSYFLTINVLNPKTHAYQVWKTVTVAPKKGTSPSTLSVVVPGFDSSKSYSWSVGAAF